MLTQQASTEGGGTLAESMTKLLGKVCYDATKSSCDVTLCRVCSCHGISADLYYVRLLLSLQDVKKKYPCHNIIFFIPSSIEQATLKLKMKCNATKSKNW